MKISAFLFLAIMAVALILWDDVAVAQNSGSEYDPSSGNLYHWHPDMLGGTHVNGVNMQTGAMWNTQIEPDGDMRGIDSDLNPWSYDSSSGVYMNLGTGAICVGRGIGRIC